MNKGIIKVTESLLKDRTGVFKRFNPIDIQIDYDNTHNSETVYKMLGYSELFDELDKGERIPEYELTITTNTVDDMIIQAKRIYDA